MKNAGLFCILFQVLKVLIKNKDTATGSFISCCFASAFTSADIQIFRTSIWLCDSQIFWRKKVLPQKMRKCTKNGPKMGFI